MLKPNSDTKSITVDLVKTGSIECFIVGTTPMIHNAFSAKAREMILDPPKKKNEAERASTVKHDPLCEFRASVYRHSGDDRPTRLMFPVGAFKRAISDCALDMPGARKAQIGRLVWIEGRDVDVYGIPLLSMMAVRLADMKRTPDIRTRAILPEWCCKLTIRFVEPLVNETVIANLLANAGLIIGIGDFRQQKGAGSYGQFSLVNEDDEEWHRIAESGGRVAQDAALAAAVPYDEEARSLLEYHAESLKRRGAVTNGTGRAKGSKRTIATASEVVQ